MDANKGINKILYNHLNLPTEIMFGTTGNITYLYDATGKKMSKKVRLNNGTADVITSYLDGFQYKNDIIQFFPTAEGYANRLNKKYQPVSPIPIASGTMTTLNAQLEIDNYTQIPKGEPDVFSYVYNYTDHLGNIRLSYTKETGTNVLKIVEENHYYPFGLKHNNYNSSKMLYVKEGTMEKQKPLPPNMAMSYNFKFNGRSWEEELGLNIIAMDYRQYDMAIGRFVGMDRLSEFTHSITPYRFALNNPNYFNDPSGLTEFTNSSEILARCPTCPNTPEFKPFIEDSKNDYIYDSKTKTAIQVFQLEEVVLHGKSNASANSSTDYHDMSLLFRSVSGSAMTAQKPLGVAFAGGTRYASQLYSAHTSNVVYKTLGGKIQVPLGNYNTATIGKLSKVLKITGKTLGVVSVGLGVVDIAKNGFNVANTLDTSMALLALSPTGAGQAIAGLYFMTNLILETTLDTNLGKIIEKQIDGE